MGEGVHRSGAGPEGAPALGGVCGGTGEEHAPHH